MKFGIKEAKSNFFDRESVLRRLDAATWKNLSKFGAFVRAAARVRLRYSDDPSAPGTPPNVHKTMTRPGKISAKTGKRGKPQGVSPLREFLAFAFDVPRRSVVIGPAKLDSVIGNAPEALEYGGTSVVRAGSGVRRVVIRPRPYMRPSLEQVKGELPAIWANSIKR